MIVVAAPARLDGELLREELAAAGVVVAVEDVLLSGDELSVNVGEGARGTVEAVAAAHNPPSVAPVDPDESLRAAIEAAATLAELKAALLGTGRPARVAGRPTVVA